MRYPDSGNIEGSDHHLLSVRLFQVISRRLYLSLSFAAIAWFIYCTTVSASESAGAVPPGMQHSIPRFRQVPIDKWGMSVMPRLATAGTMRTIFVGGRCINSATIDESSLATGILIVNASSGIACDNLLLTLSYMPRGNGALRVIMRLSDGSIATEGSMETAPVAASAMDLDGAWFDAATNGSGISFHRSPTTGAVFGTWFMFSRLAFGFGPTTWYSLQNLQWVQGGVVLEGTALAVTASSENIPCLIGTDCPRKAQAINPAGSIRLTVIDANHVRVEALDVLGNAAFASNLQRLQF